jgi:hypothetical protein
MNVGAIAPYFLEMLHISQYKNTSLAVKGQ